MQRNQGGDTPVGAGPWTAHVHDRADGSVPYEAFRQSLDLVTRITLDHAVEIILLKQGNNVCLSRWGKALRGGLYEFRVNTSLLTIWNQAEIADKPAVKSEKKVLLRVFFAVEGEKIILLLGGYNKGSSPSRKRQDNEIALARRYLKEHLEREKRSVKDKKSR